MFQQICSLFFNCTGIDKNQPFLPQTVIERQSCETCLSQEPCCECFCVFLQSSCWIFLITNIFFLMTSPSCCGFALIVGGYRNYSVFFMISLGTPSHISIVVLKKLFNKCINLSYYQQLLVELLFCNFMYKILMQI